MSEEKKDLKIKLKDDKGKYYEVISTEQFNIQEELNKEIEINIKYREVLDKIKEKVKELDRFDPCGSMAVSMSISQFQEDLERLLEEIE